MADFFKIQMDYVYLVSGLALILFAVIAGSVSKNMERRTHWKWIELFGLSFGLCQWMAWLGLSVGSHILFPVFQLILTSIAFLALIEFSRAGAKEISDPSPGKWIFIPLISLACAGGLDSLAGLNASICYALGLPGGLWACRIIWQYEKQIQKSGLEWKILASALAALTLTVVAGVPRASFFPANMINEALLLDLLPVPIALLQCLLAVVIAGAAWNRLQAHQNAAPDFLQNSHGFTYSRLLSYVLAFTLVTGWAATEMVGNNFKDHQFEHLTSRARTTAASIDTNRVLHIAGNLSDLTNPHYHRLKEQFALIKNSHHDCRHIYLMTLRDYSVVRMVDSESMDAKSDALPGDFYDEAVDEIFLVFGRHKAAVYGPYTDHSGDWLSVFVPVKDPKTKNLLAVLGMDISAAGWNQALAEHRLTPMVITLLISVLLIILLMTFKNREEKYRLLYEASNDALMLLDGKSFCDCNQATLDLFGFESSKDFCSKHPADLSPPQQPCGRDSMTLSRERIETAMQKGHARFEWVHRRTDGREFPAEVLLSAMDVHDHKIIQAVVRDISVRKNAEQELRHFQMAVEGACDAITMSSPEGTLFYNNNAFFDLFGYETVEELAECGGYSICYEDREIAKEVVEVAMCGVSWHGEVVMLTRDGERKTILVRADPIRDEAGKIASLMFIHTDITEIAESCAELEEQTQLATELATQARLANQAKTEFLANMSHEIRTPMNGIIGMTSLLMDTDLTQEQRRYAEIVRNSSESLMVIINDILDCSKIESGKLELEITDFDLYSVMEMFEESMLIRTKDTDVSFHCLIDPAIPTSLRGDPWRLRQILSNLVGNAFKFTQQGEITVVVEEHWSDEERAMLKFSVRDTGIGIPEDKQEKLFSPFVQVDGSMSRKYGGTGLGLNISKQLTEMMGGKIKVESVEGEGSTFWFTALFKKQPMSFAARAIPEKIAKEMRILIVDKHRFSRKGIEDVLNYWGIRNDVAENGRQALQMLADAAKDDDPYSLALIDRQVQGMSPQDLERKIQAEPALKGTRLIIMNAFGYGGSDEELDRAGFSAALTKPIKRAVLSDCLLRVITGKIEKQPTEKARPQEDEEKIKTRRKSYLLLLVEDNIINQKVAQGILEKKLGYRVEVAVNGREAVEALQRKPYDLVLMDCQMPEMDGFEATEKIRSADSKVINPHIPIIAMTANAMKGDREKCLDSGMDDFLSKPVVKQKLSDMLDQWLPKPEAAAGRNASNPSPETVSTPDHSTP
ncbi:MAG: response regulator [Planctomycetota bacterium]